MAAEKFDTAKENEMIVRAQQGDLFARKEVHKIFSRAMNNIIYNKGYQNMPQSTAAIRMELDEILDHAIDKYKPSMGYKPLTYLRSYVEDKVQRYVNDNARHTKIIENQNIKMGKFTQSNTALLTELGRVPNNHELLKHLKTNFPKMEALKLKDVDRMMRENRITSFGSSLVGTGDSGGHLTMEDVAYTEEVDDPLEDIVVDLNAAQLKIKVETLPEPYKTILKHTYGFDNYSKLSLRSLAAKFGINKYRIQEYIKEAEIMLKQ